MLNVNKAHSLTTYAEKWMARRLFARPMCQR